MVFVVIALITANPFGINVSIMCVQEIYSNLTLGNVTLVK